ncbi:MAG: hypothetical protein CVV46_06035 [Spirochaetae bacterium HGW-Spirochaetae-2]|nr:MAG: hypothetical protein CVV46_06035 [Spirochaetae bacterium HGW-Spirochaetae-2]
MQRYGIDLEKMPKAVREKMGKAVLRLEAVGKQANRVAPDSFVHLGLEDRTVAAEAKELGLMRVFRWAGPLLPPRHLEAFVSSVGRNVCGILLNMRCDQCPAKLYWNDNNEICQRALGYWCLKESGRE